MTVQRPEIIVYGYDGAIHAQKLFHFLAFFGIPYKYVEVPGMMPRPQLSDIGITYRRVPLLSIGSDMYVDTPLMISRLSDIAQHSDSGLVDATNHLEYSGLEQMAVRLSVGLMPLDLPIFQDEKFMADRSDLFGQKWDLDAMAGARPQTISSMLSLVQLVQGHFLKDERNFFLGGDQPTTADIYLYWILNWGLRLHGGAQPEFSSASHPKIFQWLDAITKFLEPRKSVTKISMDDANEVLRVPPKHEYAKFVPHEENNPEGLKQGQKVKVTPTDTGRSGPQLGDLISVNYEQVCLRNEKGLVMHFPRMGFEVINAA